MKKIVFLTAFLIFGLVFLFLASLSQAKLSNKETVRDEYVVVKTKENGHTPYLNLQNGKSLSATFTGNAQLVNALEQNTTHPLAVTTADFDEDGMPDLACGYDNANSGILTFYRGNVDAVYPNSPEAQQRKKRGEFTDEAFLSPAK